MLENPILELIPHKVLLYNNDIYMYMYTINLQYIVFHLPTVTSELQSRRPLNINIYYGYLSPLLYFFQNLILASVSVTLWAFIDAEDDHVLHSEPRHLQEQDLGKRIKRREV